MAEFLTTTGISYRLEEIIKNARERLVIISPFLKIDRRIRELLEDKDRLKIDIRVIYGKTELRPEESNWLESMTSIRTSFCENLHAKCYLNENEALLTSMNLYEFSQRNNEEMGILVSRDEDSELYKEINEESNRLIRTSNEIRVTVARVEASDRNNRTAAPEQTQRTVRQSSGTPTSGFCIRCKADLPANPAKPYCEQHFRSWNRYKNADYEENHCHLCGKDHAATQARPVCRDCYRKHRGLFEASPA